MNEERSSGISVLGVMQIVFIVLKLAKLINWKWYVVLWPIEVELGIIAITLLWYIVRYLCDKFFNG